jgi:tRNA nucleotidyltransferase/poly(A) polymerase
MLELAQELLAGEDAWIVGGAVRDELLGRELVDLDIACREPERAARAYARRSGGAPFPLSERHGAWRVALEDGRTVDFTPLHGTIEDDLATRDFTINAIAKPLQGGELVDPFGGGRDLEDSVLRAVSTTIFADDPLRLLRAVRLEGELGFELAADTELLLRKHAAFVDRPAGERVLAELRRLSPNGLRRLDELGLLAPLGGSVEGLERAGTCGHPDYTLVVVFGPNLKQLPISNETRRFARTLLAAKAPRDASAREIHRFRQATEPWSLEALAYLGAQSFDNEILAARANQPAEPLLRGDELDLPPGPEIGRLLEEIAEERAAGTIGTRDEALDYVQRHAQTVRKDG